MIVQRDNLGKQMPWAGIHNGDKSKVVNTCASPKRNPASSKVRKAQRRLDIRRAGVLATRTGSPWKHATMAGSGKPF